ncbi:MAG: hypothetical protein ABEJ23_08645 [Haloarculaceae archaeon]
MGSEAASFDHARHWISALVESPPTLPDGRPLLASVLLFGTVPNLVFVLYVALRGDELTGRFLFAISLTVVALNVGPYLVWYYDEHVLPQFFAKATELLPASRLDELATTYDRFFARRYWVLGLALAAAFGYTFIRSTEFLVRTGVFEPGGPFSYLLFALVVWAGFLGGVGFHGVLTTLRLVSEVASEDLSIDPLHPDKLGGLSVVGYYAIRTTVIFSAGSLFIPLAYQFIALSRYGYLIYVLVGFYAFFLLLSFVVPTVQVNRRANELRSAVLDDLRAEYQTVEQKLSRNGEVGAGADERVDELILELQAQRVRNEYEDYEQVQLYPMEIQILTRLVGSVLLPLAFLVLEVWLNHAL